MTPLLEIKNLAVSFENSGVKAFAVRNVSLTVNEGETHCIVGESGCGKSVTSFAILNLIQYPGVIESGEILFEGDNLLLKNDDEIRKIRGSKIAMIFQDPMNSLNPVYRCGDQVSEAIILHQNTTKEEALNRTIELFNQVKIPDAESRVMQYPHEMSGGMRQRVMIAMALACNPKLLIADEPTTALDVTVQAEILSLIKELQDTHNRATLFITHDLGVVSQIADRITVLYAGAIVETGSRDDILNSPKHPYTVGLLNAIPTIGSKTKRLKVISGTVPEPSETIIGCSFAPRCDYTDEKCRTTTPPTSGDNHIVICHKPLVGSNE